MRGVTGGGVRVLRRPVRIGREVLWGVRQAAHSEHRVRSGSCLPAKPSPALPASFADGRYAVRSFLGEGGRKKVYLAHAEKLDRDVAVAVIKTEGLDEAGMSRVKREAQAMDSSEYSFGYIAGWAGGGDNARAAIA